MARVEISPVEAELVRCANAERQRAIADADRVFQLRLSHVLQGNGWTQAEFVDGENGTMFAVVPDE